MKISAVSIQNFKRVKDVKITPDADRALILIGGKNGSGKSSTIDALTAAFGGKKALPADPVRHGADEAEIVIELDGGLTVRRVIDAGGESHLEVRDELGSVKAPQSVLDKLVSGRFLDPLAFLAQPAKEQRAELMKLIKDADRIATLDEKRARAFTKRTEVGRDLTKAKGELARLPEVKPGEPLDVAELTAEMKRIAEVEREASALASTAMSRVRDTQEAVERRVANTHAIEKIEAQLAELRAKEEPLAAEVRRCEEAARKANEARNEAKARLAKLLPRRDEIDVALARADKHNSEVYAQRAQAERRVEVAATVEQLDKEVTDLSKVIETIDNRKAEILAAAKLPVDGLGIDDEGITLNGVPFSQSSGAERLRVALGLAIAAAPKLGDVWIRDGALLDEESLELVAQAAQAAGKRVWVERVGTRDPGVIVIQDGTVAS